MCDAPASLWLGPPFLSTDLYRYIWDGRVQNAGLNPYAIFRRTRRWRLCATRVIYPSVNRAEYAPTIYPPVAQVIFRVVTAFSETPIAMKLAMLGFEVLAIAVMIRLLALAR